jgi:hypothetical protein
MDMIKPTNAQLIARVTLADEEDTQRVIAPNNDSDLQPVQATQVTFQPFNTC